MHDLSGNEIEALVDDYERDGYAFVRQMFTADDLAPLIDALDEGGASPGGFTVRDSTGERQELSLWTRLGTDFIGVIPRLEPLVQIVEAVIGEATYHWHSKLSWKRPGTNSRWDWHQDYGFWADEGVERPAMCTVAIALGPVDEANGCLRLVRGSHHLGRIDVTDVGESMASDPLAVDAALASLPVDLCELDCGDVVIFHSNTLHGSGPNNSDVPRTMLMSSYNAVSNPPSAPLDPGHAFHPLHVLPPSALSDGWTEVFGPSVFINPVETGYNQGYSITSAPSSR